MSQKEVSIQQQLMLLVKQLFRDRAEELNLDTEQMKTSRIVDFAKWCIEDRFIDRKTELSRGLHITEGVVDALWTILEDPYNSVPMLIAMWPTLVNTNVIKGQLDFMHLAITAGLQDGRVFQLQVPTRWDPNKPATDGFVCSVLKDQFDGMIQTLVTNGIDVLMDKYGVRVDMTNPQPRKIPPEEMGKGRLGLT